MAEMQHYTTYEIRRKSIDNLSPVPNSDSDSSETIPETMKKK